VPHSFAEQPTLTCPACGQPFTPELWLILDAAERPDLLARAGDGTLHHVVCPHGHAGEVDAPLLIYRPGASPPLLFSPAQRTTDEQDVAMSVMLLKQLRAALCDVWRDEWLEENPPFVPPTLLPLLLQSEAASAAEQHYRASGDTLALNNAVDRWDNILQAPALLDVPSDVQARLLNNMAIALRLRFQVNESRQDLERALTLLRQAAALTPAASPVAVGIRVNMANVLTDLAYMDGDPDTLEAAITIYQNVLENDRQTPQERAKSQLNLARALLYRFERGSKMADVNGAVALWKSALATAADSDKLLIMLSLSGALGTRYRATNQPADLDWALELAEALVQNASVALADYPDYQLNLGNRLRERYARDDRVEDLHRAIAVYSDARQQTAEGSVRQRAAVLNCLGQAYLERYWRLDEIGDLVSASIYCAAAVELTPASAPARATHLRALAAVLKARYDKFGSSSSDDLGQAIATLEEALRLLPVDSYRRGANLPRLGSCYEARFRATGQLHDLDQAIQTYESALASMPTSSRDRAQALYSLANALFTRFRIGGQEADAQAARRLASEAWQAAHDTDAWTALLAARLQARTGVYNGQWDEAIDAADRAHDLMERAALVSAFVPERVWWLRGTQGVAALAAYARARRGDAAGAAVALERGLAQALGGALGLQPRDRGLREKLRTEHPQLLARLDAVNSAWHDTQTSDRRALEAEPEAGEASAARRQRAQEAWANLNAVIRELNSLPGYESFLAPPSLTDIAGAAEPAQPVVYLMTTPAGSLALIVHRLGSETRVETVWAELTEAELDLLLFGRAVESGSAAPAVEGLLSAQEQGSAAQLAAIATVCPALGDRLMAPLAEQLRKLDATGVTLIPAGRLNVLPLHAADYAVGGARRVFLDEFQVAFAPSAVAAVRTRERADSVAPADLSALVVGNPLPLPAHLAPLPHAKVEAQLVASLIPGEVSVLLATEATPTAVWYAMQSHRLLHLACHARFTPRFPQRSSLVFAQGKGIALDSIRALPLFGVRLVVLSACQTALNDFRELPDEAIGFPTGFLEAGAAGVVGSLWPVDSRSTAALMADFYQRVVAGTPPVEALRAAQCWLRVATWGDLNDRYSVSLARVPTAELMAAQVEAALHDPNEKPYAHPYYWAVFAFYGV